MLSFLCCDPQSTPALYWSGAFPNLKVKHLVVRQAAAELQLGWLSFEDHSSEHTADDVGRPMWLIGYCGQHNRVDLLVSISAPILLAGVLSRL